jgi:hypothetical protein
VFAFVPFGFLEHIQSWIVVDSGFGEARAVLFDEIKIELDSPTRAFWKLKIAVDDLRVKAACLFDV